MLAYQRCIITDINNARVLMSQLRATLTIEDKLFHIVHYRRVQIEEFHNIKTMQRPKLAAHHVRLFL